MVVQLGEAQQRIASLEQELEEKQRLLQSSEDIFYRYRIVPTAGYEYVSPAVTAITGYTPEELYADAGLRMMIVHPSDRERFDKYLRGTDWLGEVIVLRWVSKGGGVIWTEQRNTPVCNAEGRLIAIEGVVRNITQRRRVEELLLDNEGKWRRLVQELPDCVALLDLNPNPPKDVLGDSP